MSKDKKYKDRGWLYEQYVQLNKSQPEIAKICGVNRSAISYWMKKFCIDARPATNRANRLKLARKIANSNGGKCLSGAYKNAHKNLKWECAESHTWHASLHNVLSNGHWCPVCARIDQSSRQTYSLEMASSLAALRGGKCISEIYVSSQSPMEWECSEGHRWTARYNNIQRGQWCPHCSGVAKHTIDDAKASAELNGGKCISNTYANTKTKMTWECARGHQWEAVYGSILTGSWCPHCAGVAPHTIEEMQKLARSKGGECLSQTYINKYTNLLWSCKKGHTWAAGAGSIISQGTWCPICASKNNIHESAFRDAIESAVGVEFPSVWPDWLRNPETGRKLEIDGYNEELKLGFEYQGRQHLEFCSRRFHKTKEDFNKQVFRDQVKRRILKKRGVRMMYPTYKLKESEFEEFIIEKLKQYGVLLIET